MYETASETFRKAIEITESYIYLIPQHFLSEASTLLQPLATLLAASLIVGLIELGRLPTKRVVKHKTEEKEIAESDGKNAICGEKDALHQYTSVANFFLAC